MDWEKILGELDFTVEDILNAEDPGEDSPPRAESLQDETSEAASYIGKGESKEKEKNKALVESQSTSLEPQQVYEIIDECSTNTPQQTASRPTVSIDVSDSLSENISDNSSPSWTPSVQGGCIEIDELSDDSDVQIIQPITIISDNAQNKPSSECIDRNVNSQPVPLSKTFDNYKDPQPGPSSKSDYFHKQFPPVPSSIFRKAYEHPQPGPSTTSDEYHKDTKTGPSKKHESSSKYDDNAHIKSKKTSNYNIDPKPGTSSVPHDIYKDPQPGPSSVRYDIYKDPQPGPSSVRYDIYKDPQPGPSSVRYDIYKDPQPGPSSVRYDIYKDPQPGPSSVAYDIYKDPQPGPSSVPSDIYKDPKPGPSSIRYDIYKDPQPGPSSVPYDIYKDPQPGPSSVRYDIYKDPQPGPSSVPYDIYKDPQPGPSSVPYDIYKDPQPGPSSRSEDWYDQTQSGISLPGPSTKDLNDKPKVSWYDDDYLSQKVGTKKKTIDYKTTQQKHKKKSDNNYATPPPDSSLQPDDHYTQSGLFASLSTSSLNSERSEPRQNSAKHPPTCFSPTNKEPETNTEEDFTRISQALNEDTPINFLELDPSNLKSPKISSRLRRILDPDDNTCTILSSMMSKQSLAKDRLTDEDTIRRAILLRGAQKYDIFDLDKQKYPMIERPVLTEGYDSSSPMISGRNDNVTKEQLKEQKEAHKNEIKKAARRGFDLAAHEKFLNQLQRPTYFSPPIEARPPRSFYTRHYFEPVTPVQPRVNRGGVPTRFQQRVAPKVVYSPIYTENEESLPYSNISPSVSEMIINNTGFVRGLDYFPDGYYPQDPQSEKQDLHDAMVEESPDADLIKMMFETYHQSLGEEHKNVTKTTVYRYFKRIDRESKIKYFAGNDFPKINENTWATAGEDEIDEELIDYANEAPELTVDFPQAWSADKDHIPSADVIEHVWKDVETAAEVTSNPSMLQQEFLPRPLSSVRKAPNFNMTNIFPPKLADDFLSLETSVRDKEFETRLKKKKDTALSPDQQKSTKQNFLDFLNIQLRTKFSKAKAADQMKDQIRLDEYLRSIPRAPPLTFEPKEPSTSTKVKGLLPFLPTNNAPPQTQTTPIPISVPEFIRRGRGRPKTPTVMRHQLVDLTNPGSAPVTIYPILPKKNPRVAKRPQKRPKVPKAKPSESSDEPLGEIKSVNQAEETSEKSANNLDDFDEDEENFNLFDLVDPSHSASVSPRAIEKGTKRTAQDQEDREALVSEVYKAWAEVLQQPLSPQTLSQADQTSSTQQMIEEFDQVLEDYWRDQEIEEQKKAEQKKKEIERIKHGHRQKDPEPKAGPSYKP